MSEFNERVRDSEALLNLNQILDLLLELESREWEHRRIVDFVNRLHAVSKNVLDRLVIADRNLVTEQTLSDLGKPSRRLLNVIQDLSTISLSEEPDYGSISQYSDNLLIAASTLPVVYIRTTPGVLQRAAEQFDHEVTSSTTELTQHMDSIRSEISDARSQMQDIVSQFEARVNQHISEAENNTDASLSQMTNTARDLLSQAKDATDRLERNVTSIQEDFRQYEQVRASDFASSQSSREEAQNVRDEEYSKWFQETQDKIISLQNQATTMLEEVAGASTANHYSVERERQNKTANIWRWIALSAFSVLVIATGIIYNNLQSSDTTLSIVDIIGRYGIIIPLSAIATYAIQQSGHHRKREQDMSRVANEMILLWPFINRVPEEDRSTLLQEIAPKYFKGGLTAQDAGDKNPLLGPSINLPGRQNRDKSGQ